MTLLGEVLISPLKSLRGETNLEFVTGLALTGSGDKTVTLRGGDCCCSWTASKLLSFGKIGDSGTLRSSSSRECNS